MEERNAWLSLSVCDGIGPVTLQKLLDYFGSACDIWDAPLENLRQSGLGPKTSEKLADFRNKFDLALYLDRLAKADVWFVTRAEDEYPTLLKQIQSPPTILYCKGDKACLDESLTRLAVVGTRKITDYGRQVTELLVTDLVAAKCVIVSGLAMGVDAVAHQTTLTARGKTIAVLGSGVDYCTPQENIRLYEQILQNGGLILSETPLGQMPNKGSFPSRNRIIAGLSQGVLVTEGAEDSGSLITAKDAIAEGRHVFAVPGPITSSVSKGPISLIGNGAKMVTTAKDILKVLRIGNTEWRIEKKMIVGDTAEEQKIIDTLQNENLSFDEIVRRTGFDSSQVGTLLSLMELKGFIKNLENGIFGIN